MKKYHAILLAACAALSLAACSGSSQSTEAAAETQAAETAASAEETEASEQAGTGEETAAETAASEEAPESVVILSYNGSNEEVELTVPYDPQRIAILDLAALDILDTLGLGDRVVGSANISLDYLSAYKDTVSLGNVKEADLEAVMGCEPDVIFIGGRLATFYDALSEIAPVVYLSTDMEIGLVESVRKNAGIIAGMFGLEDEVDGLMSGFGERIDAIKEISAGKTAIVGMCTSGSFNVLGQDGRCSLIGNELGFENIGVDANVDTATHGNEASFEFVVEKAPDYIFVMDRDSAIGTEGAQLAAEIMENELVMSTDAYKNGNLIILEHPAIWYTAEGGITALDYMIADIETALE